MKKLITITVSVLLIVFASSSLASTKYGPLDEFVDIDTTTLGQYYKLYIDTVTTNRNLTGFLELLSKSEYLNGRYKEAGLTHNQLYSPIVTLLGIKDWANLDDTRRATARLVFVELDIALAAIEATLVPTAIPEFRREVIIDAPTIRQVAKLPPTAVEVMKTLTVEEHKVTDRLNNPSPSLKVPPSISPEEVTRPPNIPTDYYGSPLPTGQK